MEGSLSVWRKRGGGREGEEEGEGEGEGEGERERSLTQSLQMLIWYTHKHVAMKQDLFGEGGRVV